MLLFPAIDLRGGQSRSEESGVGGLRLPGAFARILADR